MLHPKITKTPRQIPLRDAGAVAVQHGFDELQIVPRSYAKNFLSSRQQVPDAVPLIISECMSSLLMVAEIK